MFYLWYFVVLCFSEKSTIWYFVNDFKVPSGTLYQIPIKNAANHILVYRITMIGKR